MKIAIFHIYVPPHNLSSWCDDGDTYRMLSSTWQRVVNVKSVQIDLSVRYNVELEKLEYLFEKISMLRSVINTRLYMNHKYISFLKVLLSCNKENIEKYCVAIYDGGANIHNKLQALELINANVIEIKTMYHYIKWSYKCQILWLENVENIDENWIKYVVDNCDCSGVQNLH